MQYPSPAAAAIKWLPIYYTGLQCTAICEEGGSPCQYVCCTVKGMQKHCKEVHRWRNPQRRGGNRKHRQQATVEKMWQENQSCQRFFVSGPWQRYFLVTPQDQDQTQDQDQEQDLGQVQQQTKSQQQVLWEQVSSQAASNWQEVLSKTHSTIQEGTADEVSPWLEKTGWLGYLAGLDRQELLTSIQRLGEREGRKKVQYPSISI